MCRGSSLSDSRVISLLNQSFVSLELNVTDLGFPDCLKALKSWEGPYQRSDFYKNAFANSVVLGPSGDYILGRSGGGRRWEIDTAVVYSPDKFLTYLQMCHSGYRAIQDIVRDPSLSAAQKSERARQRIGETLQRTREFSESQRTRAGP